MNTVKHLRDLQIATLAAQGMTLCRIAQQLHIHRNTVTQRLKRPETQQLVDALLAELMQRASAQMAERLETAHQAQQEEKARKRGLRQGQGTTLAREPTYDPHWPIRQALAQRQAEAVPLDLHQWAMRHVLTLQGQAQDQTAEGQRQEQSQEQDVPLAGPEPDPQPPRRLTIREYLDQVAPWPG